MKGKIRNVRNLLGILLTLALFATLTLPLAAQTPSAEDDALLEKMAQDTCNAAKANGLDAIIVVTSNPQNPYEVVIAGTEEYAKVKSDIDAQIEKEHVNNGHHGQDATAAIMAGSVSPMNIITNGYNYCGFGFQGYAIQDTLHNVYLAPAAPYFLHNGATNYFTWTSGTSDIAPGDRIIADYGSHRCCIAGAPNIGYFTAWKESPPPRGGFGDFPQSIHLVANYKSVSYYTTSWKCENMPSYLAVLHSYANICPEP